MTQTGQSMTDYDTVNSDDTVGVYVRSSTELQEDGHQWDSISQWQREHNTTDDQVTTYADVESGVKDREDFNRLMDDVEAGDLDHVVAWELSRLSRDGETLQRFFNLCEDNEVTIWITDGAVAKITPDGQGRFVADVIGMVYVQERRSLVRRVKAGVERAKREGKWIGAVPAGFARDDNGRLTPIVDPSAHEDRDSFLEVSEALDRCDDGESYRSVARDLHMTRQGLAQLHQDEDRRQWYSQDLPSDPDDPRVSEALDEVRTDGGVG